VPEFSGIKAPLLVHIAENDEFSKPEIVTAVQEGTKGKPLIHTHIYPEVMHAFARVNGVHYDARAATIANGRSAALLAEILG
jgi:carboxymethylenebutenolidase